MTTNVPNPQKTFSDGEREAGKMFLKMRAASVWNRNGSYTIYKLLDGSMWHEFDGIHEIPGDGQIAYWLRPYEP